MRVNWTPLRWRCYEEEEKKKRVTKRDSISEKHHHWEDREWPPKLVLPHSKKRSRQFVTESNISWWSYSAPEERTTEALMDESDEEATARTGPWWSDHPRSPGLLQGDKVANDSELHMLNSRKATKWDNNCECWRQLNLKRCNKGEEESRAINYSKPINRLHKSFLSNKAVREDSYSTLQ